MIKNEVATKNVAVNKLKLMAAIAMFSVLDHDQKAS